MSHKHIPNMHLSYDSKRPPLGLLGLAHLLPNSDQDKQTNLPLLTLDAKPQTASKLTFPGSPQSFNDVQSIYRYLGRILSTNSIISTNPSVTAHLYGENAQQATQIDYLLSLSSSFQAKDTLIENVTLLEQRLLHSTFLVDQFVTIADLAVYDALMTNGRWAIFTKAMPANQSTNQSSNTSHISAFPSVQRWVRLIDGLSIMAPALSVKNAASSAAAAAKLSASSQGAGFDIDMGDVTNVCTRFPPEPSGYLHIGHAKAALLNDIIARKYGGKMILRFDDTNPKKEKEEYVDAIMEDLRTLGIQWDSLTHTSDHFDLILTYADRMIREGKAYVDATPVEEMRRQRMEGIESVYRSQTVEENMRLWNEMKAGTAEGKKCVMRAKIDMQRPNKAMRDPAIYRCNDTPHHRTGSKYKVYPTYDFACPIVDSIEGVTHALRTNEYRDRNEQYYWMIDSMGLRKPIIRDYSRLNFVYTTLSKRKLTWFVDTNRVDGWDDPRFPTVRGILRRGMTVEALREFIVGQGFSIGSNMMEYDKIWTINKRIIDPKARRFTAIAKDKAVQFTCKNLLPNADGFEAFSVPCHPKDASLGQKIVTKSSDLLIEYEDALTLKEKEEITLMSIGNAVVQSINQSNGTVSVTATFVPNGDFKKTEKKLTWLDVHPHNAADLVAVTLVELDALITVAKVEEDMNFDQIVNPNTWFETPALGEPAMRQITKGEIIQINRRGYFIADSVDLASPRGIVLIAIPDGKTKNVSVLGSKVDKAKMVGEKKADKKKEVVV